MTGDRKTAPSPPTHTAAAAWGQRRATLRKPHKTSGRCRPNPGRGGGGAAGLFLREPQGADREPVFPAGSPAAAGGPGTWWQQGWVHPHFTHHPSLLHSLILITKRSRGRSRTRTCPGLETLTQTGLGGRACTCSGHLFVTFKFPTGGSPPGATAESRPLIRPVDACRRGDPGAQEKLGDTALSATVLASVHLLGWVAPALEQFLGIGALTATPLGAPPSPGTAFSAQRCSPSAGAGAADEGPPLPPSLQGGP